MGPRRGGDPFFTADQARQHGIQAADAFVRGVSHLPYDYSGGILDLLNMAGNAVLPGDPLYTGLRQDMVDRGAELGVTRPMPTAPGTMPFYHMGAVADFAGPGAAKIMNRGMGMIDDHLIPFLKTQGQTVANQPLMQDSALPFLKEESGMATIGKPARSPQEILDGHMGLGIDNRNALENLLYSRATPDSVMNEVQFRRDLAERTAVKDLISGTQQDQRFYGNHIEDAAAMREIEDELFQYYSGVDKKFAGRMEKDNWRKREQAAMEKEISGARGEGVTEGGALSRGGVQSWDTPKPYTDAQFEKIRDYLSGMGATIKGKGEIYKALLDFEGPKTPHRILARLKDHADDVPDELYGEMMQAVNKMQNKALPDVTDVGVPGLNEGDAWMTRRDKVGGENPRAEELAMAEDSVFKYAEPGKPSTGYRQPRTMEEMRELPAEGGGPARVGDIFQDDHTQWRIEEVTPGGRMVAKDLSTGEDTFGFEPAGMTRAAGQSPIIGGRQPMSMEDMRAMHDNWPDIRAEKKEIAKELSEKLGFSPEEVMEAFGDMEQVVMGRLPTSPAFKALKENDRVTLHNRMADYVSRKDRFRLTHSNYTWDQPDSMLLGNKVRILDDQGAPNSDLFTIDSIDRRRDGTRRIAVTNDEGQRFHFNEDSLYLENALPRKEGKFNEQSIFDRSEVPTREEIDALRTQPTGSAYQDPLIYNDQLNSPFPLRDPEWDAVADRHREAMRNDPYQGSAFETERQYSNSVFGDQQRAEDLPRKTGARPKDVLNTIIKKEPKGSLLPPDVPLKGTPGVVSTRFPTAAKAQEDPMGHDLLSGYEAAKLDPDAFKHNIDLMSGYPNYRRLGARGPESKAEQLLEHSVDNLLFLHDETPRAIRDRSKLWYVGANKMANDTAATYGISPEQSAGVYAALSPQKDWFMNASLGDRLVDIYMNQRHIPADDDMVRKGLEIGAKQKTNVYTKLVKRVSGKTLWELDDPVERAVWIRMFDETYNPRSYPVVHPEGVRGDIKLTAKGEPAKAGWGSNREIASAIMMLDDPSLANISAQLGQQHKVRNFYNNILHPESPRGESTIDTHAVAAQWLRPLAGKSREVKHNFGSAPKGERGPASSAVTGMQGTYGINMEAYARAADARDILPREMQSITWEAIRGLFNNKSDRIKAQAESIWTSYQKGHMTQAEARESILELAGGINTPEWAR